VPEKYGATLVEKEIFSMNKPYYIIAQKNRIKLTGALTKQIK